MLTNEKIEEVLSKIDIVCEDIFKEECVDQEFTEEISDPVHFTPTGAACGN